MSGDWKIGDDRRRRTTDQVRAFQEANPDRVAWDTLAPADFTYVFHPHRVLVDGDDVGAFEELVAQLGDRVLTGELRRDDVDLLGGEVVRYVLPERREGQSVPEVLDLLEDNGLRPGAASPDHWVHVSPGGGGGAMCPAIEPQETGLTDPWPPPADKTGGKGGEVSVVVVDTGWHPPAATDPRTPWLAGVTGDDEVNGPELRPYAGHGTFIAGVVRCVAPETRIYVEGFAINGVGGGGILESDLVLKLEDAVAGNDSWAAPFWPAAFDWCVGVGSLDRDGRVSAFSNFGVSADVYALGRNLVNAFPDGTFTCNETPDKGDVRVFSTGLARWSGTSFSAPVVAALIAREISKTGVSARDARDAVLRSARTDSDPTIGPHQELRQPYPHP